MYQTFFHVPDTLWGMPLFGWGLLAAVWAVASMILMAVQVRRHGLTADAWGYAPLLLLIGAAVVFVLPNLVEAMPEGCQTAAFRSPAQVEAGASATGLPIRGYGVMLLVAVVSGVALAAWRAQRVGVDPEVVYALAFWMILPGIVGARAFHVIAHFRDTYLPIILDPNQGLLAGLAAMVNVAQGGLVVYGSLFGGLAGGMIFLWRKRLPQLAVFDLITPSMMLGLAIGRLGCLMNGCCFGAVCHESFPLALTFPPGSPAHTHQIEHGQTFVHGVKIGVEDSTGTPFIAAVEPGSPAASQGAKPQQRIRSINGQSMSDLGQTGVAQVLAAVRPGQPITLEIAGGGRVSWLAMKQPTSEPVWNTQVFAAINAALLCLLFLAYDPFRRRDGELCGLLLVLYSVARILEEALRDDVNKYELGSLISLSGAQAISVFLLVCGLALWVFLWTRRPHKAFPAT